MAVNTPFQLSEGEGDRAIEPVSPALIRTTRLVYEHLPLDIDGHIIAMLLPRIRISRCRQDDDMGGIPLRLVLPDHKDHQAGRGADRDIIAITGIVKLTRRVSLDTVPRKVTEGDLIALLIEGRPVDRQRTMHATAKAI